MINVIPQTLEGFKSCAKSYARAKKIPHMSGLDDAAKSIGLKSYSDVKRVYEETPDAGAFLYDISLHNLPIRILAPRRMYIPAEELQSRSPNNEKRTDGVLVSIMRQEEAATWHEKAKKLKLGRGKKDFAGHFFGSDKLVIIIHHPTSPEEMVGFLTFGIDCYIHEYVDYPEEDLDDFEVGDNPAKLSLNISMIQVAKTFQNRGYATAAIVTACHIVSSNLRHIGAVLNQKDVYELELGVEAQCLNDFSTALAHTARSEFEIAIDCLDFEIMDRPHLWEAVDIDVTLSEDWDFS